MVLEARLVVSAVFPAFLIFVSFLPQMGSVKIMRPHLWRWPWENLGVSRCMAGPKAVPSPPSQGEGREGRVPLHRGVSFSAGADGIAPQGSGSSPHRP